MKNIDLEKLPKNVKQSHEMIMQLCRDILRKSEQLKHAEETIQILRLKMFAPKSEPIVTDKSADQAGLFDEAELDVALAILDAL